MVVNGKSYVHALTVFGLFALKYHETQSKNLAYKKEKTLSRIPKPPNS